MATKKRMRVKLTKLERVIYGIATIALLFFVGFHVGTKATMTKLNIEVEELKYDIKTSEKRIESISMKVNELGSLENISMVASEMGLSYSNKNIKVID